MPKIKGLRYFYTERKSARRWHSCRLDAVVMLLLSIVMAITGCAGHSEAWGRLDKVEQLMKTSPDSALALINCINVSTLKGKEEEARYALLKSIALDKNYIDTTTFDVLQPAIDYYLRKGSPDEKLKTYYYQGRIYQNQGNKDLAMQSFMRGRDYCGESSDTLAIANLMVAQATIQYTMYKFDDFIQNNLDAAGLYHAIGRNDYEILSLANVIDGGIVTDNKQLTDSILAIAEQRVSENQELGAAIAPYILSYAVTFGNNQEIKELISYYNSLDSIDDLVKLDIVVAYCKIGDPYSAKRFMDSINPDSEVRKSLKYLAANIKVLKLNGDFAGALEAHQKFSKTIDSIHLNIFSQDLIFAKERHEMEKTNLLTIKNRDNIIWLCLCVTFILFIIAGYVYYRYRIGQTKNLLDSQEKKRLQLEGENLKRKNENLEIRNSHAELERRSLQQENEKLELEKQNAILEKQTAELECERQALAAENLRLKIKQLEDESASLKEILDKSKDLSKPIEDAIKIRIEMLNGLLATQISENESYAKPYGAWRDRLVQDKDEFMNTTRLAFKASHPKFIEYLEEHGLTESEINYVCLYAIGLRGKEVGEYMQLKRHYHISSDIRKKLGIDGHQTNVGIYIRKLMKQL